MAAPHHPIRSPRGAAGLTLFELLIAVSVAAVLVAMGAPSMVGVLHSVNLSGASNSFLAALRLARSEAQKRSSRVAMCKSADGVACTPGGGWEQGWIIFHDPNANGMLDDGETLIQRGEPVGGGLLLTGNLPVARTISFSATAGPRAVSGGLLAGTLTLCRRSLERGPAREIVIGSGGRVRVQQREVTACDGS
ncbi:MAG: methylation [Ramlibacter sp.]|nr:methylation [Ramlibacter sp.]